MLYITNQPKMVELMAGRTLEDAIQEAKLFCKKFGCSVELSFNGRTKIITDSTSVEEACKNWF
jgi:hypothetical protein